MAETDLHRVLRRLFERMVPGAYVEVTHGVAEYGKDLVLVQQESLGERVIAFVVKSGKISGQTSGPIDDIISQVRQAYKNPARLTNTPSLKDVKQVFVAMPGPLSKNAIQRIGNEVPGIVQEIWSGDRLVNLFTDYYPEVFYDSRVLDFVESKIQELEHSYLYIKTSYATNLSDWFVDPLISTETPLDGGSPSGTFQPLHVYTFQQFEDAVQTGRRRFLVTGAPGAGKSVTIAKLTIDLLGDALKTASARRHSETSRLPLLTTATELLAVETAAALFSKYFGYFGDEATFRVSVLIVDGLDEVPPEKRSQAAAKAKEYSDYFTCTLIITSRWTETLHEPVKGFHEVSILAFKNSQALRLFERLVTEDTLHAALEKGLGKIRGQIEMTPLLLILLIEVVRETKEIPASIAELFDRFLDYALGRYDHEKGIMALFDYHIKKVFLSHLSYKYFYANNVLDIPAEDFGVFCNEFFSVYGLDETQMPSFIAEIERANILRSEDIVHFSHRSFLDYFVALYIHLNFEGDEQRRIISDSFFSPIWSEVAFYAVGLGREVKPPLLDNIFNSRTGDTTASVIKMLFGRLLQAGWLSTREVKLSAVDRISLLVPEVRKHMSEYFKQNGGEAPEIVGDVFLMVAGRASLGSLFLADANEYVAKRLLGDPSYENILSSIPFLAGLSEYGNAALVSDLTDDALSAIGSAKLDSITQARLLGVLILISEASTAIKRSLERKLRRTIGRNSSLSRTVFGDTKRLITSHGKGRMIRKGRR